MARPYSDDLRRKTLDAYDQGNGTLAELAGQFCVSLAWAWKVSSARKRTGKAERPTCRLGRKQRIDEQAVAELLRARPDTPLPELKVALEKRSGFRFSTQHLWRVLKRMGFRLKNSHSTPKNGTPKENASGAKSSSQPSAPLLRRS